MHGFGVKLGVTWATGRTGDSVESLSETNEYTSRSAMHSVGDE